MHERLELAGFSNGGGTPPADIKHRPDPRCCFHSLVSQNRSSSLLRLFVILASHHVNPIRLSQYLV